MSTPQTDWTAERLARAAAEMCDEHKAEDITVLDVGDILRVTELFVIATGRNARHLKTLAETLIRWTKDEGLPRPAVEGMDHAAWVLVDLDRVVVHLFTADTREYYDLEYLWTDAPRRDWHDLDAGAA